MLKRNITDLWIAEASETEIRAALRLTGALAPSEPEWSEKTTKLLYGELKRRQTLNQRPKVVQALIFS